MSGFRMAGALLALVALLLGGCGGDGESSEVEDGIVSFLTEHGGELRVGLNPSGVIVAVNQSLVGNFSPGTEKTISEVEVSEVDVKDDDEATAKASFKLRSFSGTVTCESNVLATRRDDAWQPTLITVGSCA